MAALIRLLQRWISSSIRAPFARPPAIHTTESADMIEAAAACGFVALESSIHVTPAWVSTSSIRWRPGVNEASALLMCSWSIPAARASPAAAKALETLCGTVGLISVNSQIIAASCGSATNARSINNSSTTPISPGPGVSSEKKTFLPFHAEHLLTTSPSSALRIPVELESNKEIFVRAYSSNVPCQSVWSSAILSIALAVNWADCIQWIWKDESSRTKTSNLSLLSTASITVSPTLPQAIACKPPARIAAAVISTVVVFPFVPVIANQRWCGTSSCLICHAKSISFVKGVPAAMNFWISGCEGFQPGETITLSHSCTSISSDKKVSNRESLICLSSAIATTAPRRVSDWAKALPVTPAPKIRIRLFEKLSGI